MASVTITEILGSDSISGSRITINSNLLILQNWINGFESTFGIDTSTGVLDLTGASTGRVSALTGRFNTVSTPASGTALASVNSSGGASFVSTSTQTLAVSGATTLSGSVAMASNMTQSAGATATFAGNVTYTGKQTVGNYGSRVFNNNWSELASPVTGQGTPGLTAAFPTNASGGGGIATTVNAPYVVTGQESVIYADCSTAFYMKVADGTGATASSLPAGFRVTIINTASTAASPSIADGTLGSPAYYTGFNDDASYGGYTSIAFTSGRAYQSSVTLQWEPRIAADQATKKGSWVVISGINVTIS
jgi:hypothetical protein